MREAAGQGVDRRIGLITMGLMSSPDYSWVKNMWAPVTDDVSNYDPQDLKEIDGIVHTRFYMKQVRDAARFGLVGIVLGAPSTANHIKPEEVERVKRYDCGKLIKLVPGIGAQGGEVTTLAKNFDPRELVANVGRALMFPVGQYSGTDDWIAAAIAYRDKLNELRAA